MVALGLFLVMLVLGGNLIRSMVKQASGLMYFMMGVSVLALVVVVIEYVRLLVIDPSDARIHNAGEGVGEEKECEQCRCRVAASSYHCQSCNRCVEEFDHHCSFVNNCIGKRNYAVFIRLLISLLFHSGTNIGITVWVMVAESDAYRWIALVFGVLNLLFFLEIGALGVFHCYIGYYL